MDRRREAESRENQLVASHLLTATTYEARVGNTRPIVNRAMPRAAFDFDSSKSKRRFGHASSIHAGPVFQEAAALNGLS